MQGGVTTDIQQPGMTHLPPVIGKQDTVEAQGNSSRGEISSLKRMLGIFRKGT